MGEHKLLTRKYLDSNEAREKFKIGHIYFDGRPTSNYEVDKLINEHGIGRYHFTYREAFLIIDHHLIANVDYPTIDFSGKDSRDIDDIAYQAKMMYTLYNIRLRDDVYTGRPLNSAFMEFSYAATIEVDTDERNNPKKVHDYAYLLSSDWRSVIFPLMEGKFLDNNVVLTPKLVVDLGLGVDKFIFNNYSNPTDSKSDSYNECIYSMDLVPAPAKSKYILGIEPNVYDVVTKSMEDHLGDPIHNRVLEWTCESSYDYLSLLKINPSSYKDLESCKKVEDLSILQERIISSIRGVTPNSDVLSDKSGVGKSNDNDYTITYSKFVVGSHNHTFMWDVVYTISKNARLIYSSESNTAHLMASVYIRFIDTQGVLDNLKEYLDYHGRAPSFSVSTRDPSDSQYSLANAGVTFEL